MSFAVFATAIISAMLINNVILMQFLGVCPFLGVSKRSSSAIGMSAAVLFVMVIASAVTYTLYDLVLYEFNIPYISTIAFILVIASLVQFVEMVIKRYSTPLYKSLGIYLPLITTNCAILGVSEGNIANIWTETMPYGEGLFIALSTAIGTGLGFGLIIFAFSSIRERMDGLNIPEAWKGVPISLLVAGIMSLAFVGLVGVI
ncbi:electron transport complex protein RnfA [Candidatus Xianfuyuplasma coldseepsis]|uniref:Electron transport complex subunit RsxA n=1 Tax=Candidatus Xianfuyuplasma coldseepsis TaxID=2782163 RepID=A0A7L7KNH5_9MOLU|nr:Rnf-Nqr domain containing protein [Xianfuyuplasma coldseepsis]QMS84280.1 electron transport complex subunit RsxA [Xianfuyuplasma coldseepsis]